jgi:hypothetical protein
MGRAKIHLFLFFSELDELHTLRDRAFVRFSDRHFSRKAPWQSVAKPPR